MNKEFTCRYCGREFETYFSQIYHESCQCKLITREERIANEASTSSNVQSDGSIPSTSIEPPLEPIPSTSGNVSIMYLVNKKIC